MEGKPAVQDPKMSGHFLKSAQLIVVFLLPALRNLPI